MEAVMQKTTENRTARPGFAIQQYPDIDNIYNKIDALVKHPITGIDRPAMDTYLKILNEKCGASKSMIGEAMNYIPGGVQHNLAFNYPFSNGVHQS